MGAGINRFFFILFISCYEDKSTFSISFTNLKLWIKKGCPGFLTPQVGRPASIITHHVSWGERSELHAWRKSQGEGNLIPKVYIFH